MTIKISEIKVQELDYEDLTKRTLKAKEKWYQQISWERGEYDYSDPESADAKTQDRWKVNYIRHNLTSYDSTLYNMSGKVGCHEEYLRYKLAVMDKIAETYPYLKSECSIQKQKARTQYGEQFNLKEEIEEK